VAADDPGDRIAAVVLDMDGVVTDVAEAHFAAWKEAFDALLAERGEAGGFTRRDYLEHVDGVPRDHGVRRFLAARGIELPDGGAEEAGLDTVHGIGNLKTRRLRAWLEQHRVAVFDDAAALIDGLKRAGVKVGVFSASRNAGWVLESAGLQHTFDAAVDGADVRNLGLAPKPDPAQLVETARRLGCAPAQAAVVDDAVSGVQAGAAGRFGLVIGVNRQEHEASRQRHALRSSGADMVTRDLRRLLLPGGGGIRTVDRLPLVWDRLDALRERVGGRRPSVFLDYDGTLAPIVADHRRATMPEATRAEIRRLAGHCPVAVISGRDLADVRRRVGIDDIVYAGSHGFDIAGPDGLRQRPDAAERFLGAIGSVDGELRERVGAIAGVNVERKTFSVAVHFREVAEGDVEAVETAVDGVVRGYPELRKGRGKKVLEIQPRAEWDKGSAVEWLLGHTALGAGEALPLYLGDDLTDEDAFAVLSDTGLGLVVRGGRRATLADYALADPGDVCRFLAWLSDAQAQRR